MKMYQVWIRKRDAKCSHTETVYIEAFDHEDAWRRADALFLEHFTVKSVRPMDASIVQTRCGCGDSIMWTAVDEYSFPE